MQLKCFIESQFYHLNDSTEVKASLKDFPDLVEFKDDGLIFKLVGILLFGEVPIVVFPKGFVLPESLKELQTDASILLRTLLRYRDTHDFEFDEFDILRGNHHNNNGRIITALSLLDDYQSNGIIRRKSSEDRNKVNGFIDWNKTLKVKVPILHGHKASYLDPVIRASFLDPFNVISIIHRDVINDCINSFGWICGMSPNEDNDFKQCQLTIPEMVSILKKELRVTYIQREIIILKQLVQFLTAKYGNEKPYKVEILATRYFQNVWESICGYVFKNEYTVLKAIVPVPIWRGAPIACNPRQIPDILFRVNDCLFILDAKYYDYRVSLPGEHDIVKQFFYKYSIEQNLKHSAEFPAWPQGISSITNFFILPENSTSDISYLGNISVKNVDDVGRIEVFSINLLKVMQLYASHRPSSLRELLITAFEEVVLK